MDLLTKHLAFLTKFFLNNDPEDASFQDTTVWASTGETGDGYAQNATVVAQVEIVINAYLPNGTIYHDGDDTFTTPDIDRDVTDILQGIPITKDVNNQLIQGAYRADFLYKVTDSIVDVDIVLETQSGGGVGSGRVELIGNWTLQLTGETLIRIVNSAANDATYTVANFTYIASSDRTRIDFNEDFAQSEFDTLGELEITYTHTYALSQTSQYNYEATPGCIVLTADCDKSELRSQDLTDYAQYDNGVPISRNHVLKYPVDLVPAQADIPSENEIISINPIYTNVWTATIAPIVEITGTDGLIVQDTLHATESIDVQCDVQWCAILTCLENIATNYEKAITNGSQSEIQRWEQSYDKIQGYYMLWRISRSCGDNEKAAEYYGKAVDEANAQDCCTPVDSKAKSEPSKLIQAISTGGLTTIYNELVNQWFEGDGPPAGGLGDNGDLYLNTIGQGIAGNGDIYVRELGVWNITSNIAGDNGAPGTNGLDGNNGTQILALDVLDDNDDGVDGDYNIRSNATIDRKQGGAWDQYADPNGEDGADGLRGTQMFNEAGVPGNGIGLTGDYSIDATSALIYRKTDDDTLFWELYTDPNGADGTGMLFVNAADTSILIPDLDKNTWLIFPGSTYTLPTGILSVGDTLKFTMNFFRNSGAPDGASKIRFEFPGKQFSHTLIAGENAITLTFELMYRGGGGGDQWTYICEISSASQPDYVSSNVNLATMYKTTGAIASAASHGAVPIDFDWYYRDESSNGSGQTFNSSMFRVELIKV
jgi:hypothetical protein